MFFPVSDGIFCHPKILGLCVPSLDPPVLPTGKYSNIQCISCLYIYIYIVSEYSQTSNPYGVCFFQRSVCAGAHCNMFQNTICSRQTQPAHRRQTKRTPQHKTTTKRCIVMKNDNSNAVILRSATSRRRMCLL